MVKAALTNPSPWSKVRPKLQLAWDSTSLRALMACPRRYQYSIIEGWRGSGVDVEFGGMFAKALEEGWKVRAKGGSRDEAQLASLKCALEASGGYMVQYDKNTLQRIEDGPWVPWGGMYMTQWKCTGEDETGAKVPFRNAKGNVAKCPYSHKSAWFDPPAPSVCKCGAQTKTQERWLPAHASKDRYGLIRLVVWYWEEQAEGDDGLGVYTFPDGTPAVELSFAFPLGEGFEYHGLENVPTDVSPDGLKTTSEPYLLCGHLDTIKTNGVDVFPSDNKTTGKFLGKTYFAQYSPDIQIDTYDFACSVLYPSLGHQEFLLEAAQVLASGAEFVAQPLTPRTEAHREEYLRDLRYWLDQAEKFAEEDYWPMNRSSCYLCQFKGVCSSAPSLRDHMLKATFVKRPWNPLEVR